MSRSLAFAMLTALSASLVAGPPAPAPGGCGGVYTVVRGDTLYSIARRCRSSVVAIAGASRLADPRRIEVGQQLVIPGLGAPEPGKEEPAADSGLVYRFTPGDTLYSLARWARTSVGEVIAANPGIDPHKVEIGDEIRLPAGAVSPDAARRREFGTGPGPALMLRRPPMRVQEDRLRPAPVRPPRAGEDRPRPAPAPPPRIRADRPRPAPPAPPPAPRRDKPDDEREPEGM